MYCCKGRGTKVLLSFSLCFSNGKKFINTLFYFLTHFLLSVFITELTTNKITLKGKNILKNTLHTIILTTKKIFNLLNVLIIRKRTQIDVQYLPKNVFLVNTNNMNCESNWKPKFFFFFFFFPSLIFDRPCVLPANKSISFFYLWREIIV